MKFFLFLLIINILFANEELLQIETSIKKAKKAFEIQKKENNISKLLEISKILYENNKKLKKLKEKYYPKLSLELISQKPLDNLQIGDILEIEAKTSHNKSEEYTNSGLDFFIYKKDTLLATKHIELYEKGSIHKEHIKFKIIKPDENYKVCALFEENGEKYKKCKTFSVFQPIVTKPIITSVFLNTTSSDKVLIPNKKFYLFMPFKNNTQIPLKGQITITDAKSKEVIFDKKFEKQPSKEFKKIGVLIPAKLALENRVLHVSVSLGAEGINPIKKEKTVKISSYEWEANFPAKLKTNQTKKFYISPPKAFQKPLKISVNPNGGILIGHKKNRLNGTIEAITDKKETAYIDINIEDANKNRVTKRIYITLNQDYIHNKKNYITKLNLGNKRFIRYPKKEVVIDKATNLMWQDNKNVKILNLKWKEAVKYCNNLTLGGYSDWRLPTIKELYSLIVKKNRKEYYLIDKAFKNLNELGFYWSSTTYAKKHNKAWEIDFFDAEWNNYGYKSTNYKSNYNGIRCVRYNK